MKRKAEPTVSSKRVKTAEGTRDLPLAAVAPACLASHRKAAAPSTLSRSSQSLVPSAKANQISAPSVVDATGLLTRVCMMQLVQFGYVVMPLFPSVRAAQSTLGITNKYMSTVLSEIPELKDSSALLAANEWLGVDCTGVLPYASTQHHMIVRLLRQWIHYCVVKHALGPIAKEKQCRVEQLIEQIVYKPERFRDREAKPEATASEEIYHGFLNCDAGGVQSIWVGTAAGNVQVYVPPDHVFLCTGTYRNAELDTYPAQHRLNVAFRLTASDTVLSGDNAHFVELLQERVLVDGRSRAHLLYDDSVVEKSKHVIVDFSHKLRDDLCYKVVHANGPLPGQTYRFASRRLPPWKADHRLANRFPKYSRDEVALFMPNTTFNCLKPGTNRAETVTFLE